MRVSGSGPLQAPAIRRPGQQRKASAGEFASELAGGAPAHGVSVGSQVDSLSGILAAQEVGDRDEERRHARTRGEFMLDRLDEIRLGLLTGRIPVDRLAQLVRAVQRRRENLGDPRLREVLDEIELRASVELAKLRRLD